MSRPGILNRAESVRGDTPSGGVFFGAATSGVKKSGGSSAAALGTGKNSRSASSSSSSSSSTGKKGGKDRGVFFDVGSQDTKASSSASSFLPAVG